MNSFDATSYDSVVHIIQLSLSPIFLLTAVATLLNVFTTRLARISDQVKAAPTPDKTDEVGKAFARARLTFLRRRTSALDAAVILAALAGGCICGTVLTLFFGILRDRTTLGLLFSLFGAAIVCTLGALTAFLVEVLLASRGIRVEAAKEAARVDG